MTFVEHMLAWIDHYLSSGYAPRNTNNTNQLQPEDKMQHRPRFSSFSFPSHIFGRKLQRIHAGFVLSIWLLFSTLAVGQSCTVDISTNPSSPVPAGQAVNVSATVSAGSRQIGGGGLLTASVNYDGSSICSSFSDSCSVVIDPGSPGFHSFDWSCMDTNTGDSNSGSQSLQVGTSTTPQTLVPQYFILSLLYNAPGKDSTSGYSNNTNASVTASIEQDIGQGSSTSFDSSGDSLLDAFISGVSFSFSATQGNAQAFTVTASSTQGSQIKSTEDFVDHYQDRFYLWLNPRINVTQSGTFQLSTLIGSNGQPEPMDVLDFSVADLLNPSQIPLEKLQPLPVDGVMVPGLSSICAHAVACTVTNACGCTSSDFTTILRQDPLIFPIVGSNGGQVSANDPPTLVDNKRFLKIPVSAFLDGGGASNTITIDDSAVRSNTQNETIMLTVGFFGSTFTFTEIASTAVAVGQSHEETVTLASPTSGCDEFVDIYEDLLYHTFVVVPAAAPPAACQTQDPAFSIAATPSFMEVVAGGSGSYGVSTLGMFGFTGAESLTVTGLPSGAFATFSPSSIAGTGASELKIVSSSTTPVGDSQLTITGTSQGITRTTAVTLRVSDFSVSATPGSQGTTPNGSTSYAVTISSLDQFDFDVALSVAGLPNGATASFSPSSIHGSGTSTLTITNNGTTPGQYPLTIAGASHGVTHTTNVILNVFDFAVSVTPTSQTVIAGGSASYNVSVTGSSGFTGNVTCSIPGLPPGVTTTVNPGSINGSGSFTVSVATSNSTPGDSYALTISCTSGSIAHTATATLVVQNFVLSPTPASRSVNPGGSASYTVTVSPQNGFSGAVSLSVSGLPACVTATLNPSTITGTGSSTLTLVTTSCVAPGSITIVVTGTSGNLTHSTQVTLVVGCGIGINVSPASQTVFAGSNTSYTVNVTSSGNCGSVSLSVSGLPASITPTFNPSTISGSGSSTLTLSVANSTAPTTYPFTISATASSLISSAAATLVVNPSPGDFTLSATPRFQTVTVGDSASFNITVTPSNGFSGNVALDLSGLPGDAFASFSPPSINGSGTSLLGISTSTSTGTYTITITGTSGSLTHSVAVTLTINPSSGGCGPGQLGRRGDPCPLQ